MSGSGSGMVKPTSAMRQGAPSRLYRGRELIKHPYLIQDFWDIAQRLNAPRDNHTAVLKGLPCLIIKCCYFCDIDLRH